MKWVLSHQSSEHHRWLLLDAQTPAQLIYNLENHSLRIKAQKARLFFLEPTGFLHKKVLLRSEYGVVLGEAQWADKTGWLLIDERKYFYQWTDQQLLLLDKNKSTLLQTKVECRSDTDRLEKFAFVFCSAWLHHASTEAHKTETLLVA